MKEEIRKEHIFTICWILMYFVFFLQIMSQASIVEAILFPLFFGLLTYHATKYLSLDLLQKAITHKRLLPFIFQFIACSLFSATVAYSCRYLFYFLEREGYFPASAFFNLEYGFIDFIGAFLSIGIIVNLCFCGFGFYLAYSDLRKRHLETQLQMLQAQITPHFMFNVLHHVNMLMQKDVDVASELLIKYSNILRYQLYSGKEDFVPIAQEVQFLQEFIYVEQIRWRDKLDVKSSWNVDNNDFKIPPALLIVLIENAFKHVSRTTTEKGYIYIRLVQEGYCVRLTVENSKFLVPGITYKKMNSGIGLENIKKRLDIIYPRKHQLTINETESNYFSELKICNND